MVVFGFDISHHQGGFDHQRARGEGMCFMYAKCTEGQGFRDVMWPTNRDAALDAGLYVAAYHFLRQDSSAAAQAANLAAHLGDLTIPVVVDCEPSGSSRPTLGRARAFVDECRGRGVFCSLLYLPRWYWEQLEDQNLADLPPLIQSHYGPNDPGTPEQLYPGDVSPRWAYGEHHPLFLQFGSQILIAGQKIDGNAYRGDVQDLAAWFKPPEADMALTQEDLDLVVNPNAKPEDRFTFRDALKDAHWARKRAAQFYGHEVSRDQAEAQRQVADRQAIVAEIRKVASGEVDAEAIATAVINLQVERLSE